MTNQELEVALKTLGITQGELSKRFGVRPETVHRWVRGIRGKLSKVPGPVAVSVEMWLQQHAQKEAQTQDIL